jgi:hypothetical protein
MAKFDPKDKLSKVDGKDYLEVKWRLVWFRDVWPNGTITTEPLELSDQRAVFRATVTAIDADGVIRGSATGTKASSPQQFKRGYIEKAETGAIGRALAALGFGTQFEPEFDEGEHIVDAPVESPRAPQRAQKPASAPKAAATIPDAAPRNERTTDAMKRLHAVGNAKGIDHDGLRMLVIAKATKSGLSIASLNEAPGALLSEAADAIEADAPKILAWLEKQRTEQAPLMPGIDEVPNPDRYTR